MWATVDVNRLIRCIEEKEQGKWTELGGGLCFTEATWSEHSPLPYVGAQDRAAAYRVATTVFLRSAAALRVRNINPTPYILAYRWRYGLTAAIRHSRTKNRQAEYATGVANLYNDKEFP